MDLIGNRTLRSVLRKRVAQQPEKSFIRFENRSYIYTGELMARSIALTPEDRTFIVLPLFHGNAQYYSTMSAIMIGAGIAVKEKFSASRYFKQAKALGGTVGSLFAAPFRMILVKGYEKEARIIRYDLSFLHRTPMNTI